MIRKILFNICGFFSLAVFLFMIITIALVMYFNAPNSYHQEDKKFVIENGLTFREVVEKLHKEHIVRDPISFLYIAQLVKGYNPTVRYGEYFFEKNISYYKVMHKINKGYIYFRKVTIAEGLSTNSALKIIANSPALIGEVPKEVPEGSLLPETYFYSYNDTKVAMVKRMQAAMQRTVDELWERRDKTVPIRNKYEAIVLASIVEKESAPGESPKVASVFINRLRKGMKLQSDPTIVYSFTMGNKDLERVIRKSDILNNSKYNTYHVFGLPPTPICNPGISSIKAVLNPPETNYLYFVATGKGDHHFSASPKEHGQYVMQYYQFLRQKEDKQILEDEKAEARNKKAETKNILKQKEEGQILEDEKAEAKNKKAEVKNMPN